jgi:cytochrome c oxidase subunit 2
VQPRVSGLRGPNARTGLRGPNARTRRRSARSLGRLIPLAAGLALATGCGSSLGLPPSATEQGDAVTDLWRILVIMAGLVTLLIWLLTAFVIIASIRRRRREGRDGVPVQHQYRTGLEVVYTVTPLLLVMGILVMTFVATQRLTAEERPDLTVSVLGFQWQWQFDYRDKAVRLNGDHATLPQLWLPVGRRVRFEVSSPDVIHAFWVPDFLEKRDMIPGAVNVVEVNVKAPGQWTGRCAEYCGLEHATMKFAVCAVEPAAFDAWVTATAAKPQPVIAGVRADGTGPSDGAAVCPSPAAPGTGLANPDLPGAAQPTGGGS